MQLRTKVLMGSMLLVLGSAMTVASLSYLNIRKTSLSNEKTSVEQSLRLAEGIVTDISNRLSTNSLLLASNPSISSLLTAGDRTALEKAFVDQFKAVKMSDPTITVFEGLDASGKVAIRGHNPGKFGDTKTKEPGIISALAGKPYAALTISPTSGDASLVSTRPLHDDKNQIIGALTLGAGLRANTALEIKARTGLDVVFVAAGKVTAATFDNKSALDLTVPKETIEKAINQNNEPVFVDVFGVEYAARAIPMTSDNGHQLSIIVYRNRSSHHAELDKLLREMAMMVGLFSLLILPVVALVVHRAMRRITLLANATTQIANGDLERDVPGSLDRDEIGELAKAVLIFKDITAQGRVLEDEAKRQHELTAKERIATMNEVAETLKAMIGSVSHQLSENSATMQVSAEGLDDLAESAQTASSTATTANVSAAEDVLAVSNASNELATSIAEIGRQVELAAELTAKAVSDNQHIADLVHELVQSADQIKDAVGTIAGIASLTNLLALNATIEASRAGEAGKGFAVVAAEVKSLATQTAKATGDINRQIDSVINATSNVMQAVGGATTIIDRLDGIASSIAAAVEEQNAATEEISRSISNASGRSLVAREAGDSVSTIVTDVKSEAGRVKAAADVIMLQTNTLNETVDQVVTQIRAA